MGFNLNKAKAAKEEILKSFTPLELNEGNVQAIFNRCLATKNTKELTRATLFPPTRGYKEGTEKLIYFDKEALLKNKKSKTENASFQQFYSTTKRMLSTID